MNPTKKPLVVYFSHPGENYNVGVIEEGNTKLLAKTIIKELKADEFEIIPKNPYPNSYQETIDLATKELENNARPEYNGEIDISNYDTIFIGYPIWWRDLPMILYTFIENHNWDNKTIIPFNTHEGSGNSGTYNSLKTKLPEAIFKGDGFNIRGSLARTNEGIEKLKTWLNNL